MHGSTGHDQITDAGQAPKGFHLAAHLHTEPGDFRNAPGNEGGLRIVSVAQTIRDARCQCDDVLQRCTDLNTLHIRIDVYTEAGQHEGILNFPGRCLGMGRGHNGGGDQTRNLLRVGRTGQHRHIRLGKHLLQNVCHGHHASLFDTLCHRNQDLALPDIGLHFLCRAPNIYRRNCHHQQLTFLHHLLQIA